MMLHPKDRAAAAIVLCLLALAVARPSGAQGDVGAEAVLAGEPLSVTLSEPLTAPALAAAPKGVKTGPRSVSIISTTKQAGPLTVPLGPGGVLPINRQVKSLPRMRALTKSQMDRQYTGAAAPRAFHRAQAGDGIAPMANGLAGAAFSDSRFSPEYYTLGQQRTGRLYMRFNEKWYSCSASVINRALLVTAAHCLCFQSKGKGPVCLPDMVNGTLQVAFELGLSEPQDADWWPTWTAAGVMVPLPYMMQTDTSIGGVVTNNDLALVWLNPKEDVGEVGDVGGWNSYGTNGYSFAQPVAGYGFPSAPATALATSIGYPAGFDGRWMPQISHSAIYNFVTGGAPTGQKPPPPGAPGAGVPGLKNMIRGTAFTPGSSGSPWIVNYGTDANVTSWDDGAPPGGYGFNAERNVVIGVVSWGYIDPLALAEGSSFFGVNREYPDTYGTRGSGNIAALMYDACDNPDFEDWQLAARDPPLCE